MGKAERTKQQIIEQAAPIFNEKGIAGTTIDDVLQAAKVAKGCLYNHFENKEALSYATVDYLLEKITGNIAMIMNRESSAKAKIYAYLDANKNPLETYIDGGCPIFNMAVESDNNNPVVKQKIRQVLISGQKMFARIIREGIQNGEWGGTLNPEEFSFKMFSAVEGATVICRILERNEPMHSLIKGFMAELEGHELS